MPAPRSPHLRVDLRKPVDAGAPVDARASEGRAIEHDARLGHSDQAMSPTLPEALALAIQLAVHRQARLAIESRPTIYLVKPRKRSV